MTGHVVAVISTLADPVTQAFGGKLAKTDKRSPKTGGSTTCWHRGLLHASFFLSEPEDTRDISLSLVSGAAGSHVFAVITADPVTEVFGGKLAKTDKRTPKTGSSMTCWHRGLLHASLFLSEPEDTRDISSIFDIVFGQWGRQKLCFDV